MAANELEMFLHTWDREAQSTAKLLRALPVDAVRFPAGCGWPIARRARVASR